jgi:hypothetical protein
VPGERYVMSEGMGREYRRDGVMGREIVVEG